MAIRAGTWQGKAGRAAMLTLGLALLTTACGYDHDQWHGKTRAELIHAWGPPLAERALQNDLKWLTIAYSPADRNSPAPCYMVYELDRGDVVRSSFTFGC